MSSGVWVTVLPYLGFPQYLKNILFSLSGLGIAYLSYVIYMGHKNDKDGKNFENFSENDDYGSKV